MRAEIQARLARLPAARRALEEEVVTAAIQDTAEWRRAGTVLLYRSLPSEFSTVGLANGAWRAGKRVAMPRVSGPGELVLHEVRAWTDLRPGAFGIHEPLATLPVVQPAAVDLAVVPGIGWQEDGHRLGRGGGHYDRLVPRLALCWGIAFDRQVVEGLPLEAHDARVHRVWHAALLGAGEPPTERH